MRGDGCVRLPIGSACLFKQVCLLHPLLLSRLTLSHIFSFMYFIISISVCLYVSLSQRGAGEFGASGRAQRADGAAPPVGRLSRHPARPAVVDSPHTRRLLPQVSS